VFGLVDIWFRLKYKTHVKYYVIASVRDDCPNEEKWMIKKKKKAMS